LTQSPERSSGPEAASQRVGEWLATPRWHARIGALLERDAAAQANLGYVHTLREICQQPVTWVETASSLAENSAFSEALAAGVTGKDGGIVVTSTAWSRALRSTNGPERRGPMTKILNATPEIEGRTMPGRGRS
jgi:hypothetical protein